MPTLLLTETAFRELKDDLQPFQDALQIIRMRSDGSLYSDAEQAAGDSPIHLAWLSHDLFEEGTAQPFIRHLQSAPDLQWLQTVSAGLDHPLFRNFHERGITQTNSDTQSPAIAEYVVAGVLHRYQQFPLRAEHQAARRWQDTDFREICGSNWLVIGFGNIGRRIGRIVKAFDGHVVGVKRSRQSLAEADQIVTFDDIDSQLARADVVVLACALTGGTRNLLNVARIQAMKPGAVLVNIARGEVVDEPALLQSLDSGQLDYAILDVFQQEPLPADSPFWTHPRVLVTPHSSNRGTGTKPRSRALFLENLRNWLNRAPLRNLVDDSFFSDPA